MQRNPSMTTFDIRPLVAGDLPAVKAAIDTTGLFPSELLEDMTAPFLGGTAGDEFWLVAAEDGRAGAVAYCAPERMTSGTWNLLLIAVREDRQGRGLGGLLTRRVEHEAAGRGGRILLVETSGLPAFERTRAVYRRLGYSEEARIRDFYAAGDDKIVFRKAIGRADGG